jgi:hypothetical protein
MISAGWKMLSVGRAALLLLPLVAVGCSSAEQDRDILPSGFLSKEFAWQEDEEDDALYWYQKPDWERSRYQSIMIDPVWVWSRLDRDFSAAAKNDLDRLSGFLFRELGRALKQHFKIVFLPSRSTLRLQVAITELKGSKPLLYAGSASGPQRNGVTTLKTLSTETHAFLGRAVIEYELIDSLGGETCLAAIDARSEGKALSGVSDEWDDVQEALAYWADDLARRLK